VLSAIVLIVCNISSPSRRKSTQEQWPRNSRIAQKQNPPQPTAAGQPTPAPARPACPRFRAPRPRQPAVIAATRAAALSASARVPIATDSLQGSIALKGGRIDDLALVKFRETVDPKSRRSCCCRRPAALSRSMPNSAGPMRPAPMSKCRMPIRSGNNRARCAQRHEPPSR